MTAEVVNFWGWLRERWPYVPTVREYDERNETKSSMSMSTETSIPSQEDDIEIPMGMGEVTPIRKIQPGDVLDVVIKLRQLAALYETCSYTLYANFEDVCGDLAEKEATKTRHTLELATGRVYALLTAIEKTEAYQELRRTTLANRRDRNARTRIKNDR